MLADQRRSTIVDLVHESGGVSVHSLAENLSVSASTIRRDLKLLDRAGRLQRVRGGGRVEADREAYETVAYRSSSEKSRIGAYAASLVPDGAIVLVDIGTTCAAIAHHLQGRHVTVVTASLAVVDQLRDDRAVELVVLGGVLRPSYRSLVGALTQQAITQLRADIAFIGASGVDPDGTVLDTTGIEVPIKRTILENSDRNYLTISADKIPGRGVLTVANVTDFSEIITTASQEQTAFAGVDDQVRVKHL
jgi:DeoR/GlpR family transcriptional regulator of sugar metabolism